MKKLIILLAILTLTSATNVKAAEVCTEAILHYNQGIDYYKTGQYDAAIESFKQAIDIDPNYIDAYYNLGTVLEYLQKYDAALTIFKRIIVRRPDDYDSVYKAAWLSAQLGQDQKAKTYLSIIPPSCERAKDAQALASKLKVNLVEPPKEAEKPKASGLPQSNGEYQDLMSPTGITADESGNLYVAGFTDNMITKITPAGEKKIFVKNPKIDGPIGLAADAAGNIYIANYNKDNVLKVSNLGEVTVLIANVKKPYCLYVKGKMLFVSCQGTSSVLRYKLNN